MTARPPSSKHLSVANRSTLSANAQNMLRNKRILMRPPETHRHHRSQKIFISRDAPAPPLAPVPPRPAGVSLRLNHGVRRRTEVWHVRRQLRARILARCHFAKNVNFFPQPPHSHSPPRYYRSDHSSGECRRLSVFDDIEQTFRFQVAHGQRSSQTGLVSEP